MPSERLRKLEIEANTAFDQYRELYFEGGVSSVYLWDLDAGFAGVILIKKAGDGSKKIKGKFHDDLIFTDYGHTQRLDP
jgi:capping protein beta